MKYYAKLNIQFRSFYFMNTLGGLEDAETTKEINTHDGASREVKETCHTRRTQ